MKDATNNRAISDDTHRERVRAIQGVVALLADHDAVA